MFFLEGLDVIGANDYLESRGRDEKVGGEGAARYFATFKAVANCLQILSGKNEEEEGWSNIRIKGDKPAWPVDQ